METRAGIKLTKKQEENVKALEKLLKVWDKNLCINSIAGSLTIMLRGDTKQNETPEISDTGGFNPENIIEPFNNNQVLSDGGDW